MQNIILSLTLTCNKMIKTVFYKYYFMIYWIVKNACKNNAVHVKLKGWHKKCCFLLNLDKKVRVLQNVCLLQNFIKQPTISTL